MNTDNLLDIDLDKLNDVLIEFIRVELARTGKARLVVGVSGGVDSALVAYLSANAIGNENVVGVIMPYKTSNPDNMADAEEVIETIGIKRHLVDISPRVDSYFELFPDADNVRRGNKMARERMSVLYDISHMENAVVIGTSNRSEILLGYGTIFGDLACALNPIGSLYKTQVRALAGYLGVPERIIAKPPSADLYTGQSDEGEFGFTYSDVDKLLVMMFDLGLSTEECVAAGYSKDMIGRVNDMFAKNSFKGRPPVIADISGLGQRGLGVPQK